MEGINCSQFIFYNDFDSANMAKVEFIPQANSAFCKQNSNKSSDIIDAEFNVWTKPDCCGTEFENGNRTWFYFAMRAPEPCLMVKFNLVDINRQGKMYSQGMAPVYRILPGKPKWERVHDKPSFNYEDNIFTLSFKFRTPESTEGCTYFAFTYPFSYVELDRMMVNIDAKYLSIQPICNSDIYYIREVICHSLEGRRVDLLTITSYHGITTQREERLKSLFPDTNVLRPHKFVGKKIIFVSARVHPGETPSSYVFNGLLNLLLNRDDLIAQALRKHYVFKMIPFLNPDGVARGHYRTDTRGANLNRVYLNPSLTEHPSIFAARSLIRYYHFGVEKEDKIPKCDNCKLGIQPAPSTASDESENIPNDQNESLTQMAQMSLDEDGKGGTPWCTKCKAGILKFEATMPGISTLIPTFNLNRPLGHNFCRNCGSQLTHTISKEEIKFESIGSHGDVNSNESGLFLYLDLHGHASKKGIFMYGNHFDDLERRVECMLLPKLMSLNNHNFHFQGCNFTERNMYLRDKRDGMSRAGSGRVAVLSITGVIKSYTLECNYNTGRLVNVLPPTVKEPNGKCHTLPTPPKYTPAIFEEAGRSLGASILDLTSQNPFSRLPNSEFHTISGLREWLRTSCNTNDFGESRPKMTRIKTRSGGLQNQGKTRGVIIKNRPPLAKTVLRKKSKNRTSIPIDRKENLACHPSSITQPGCSYSITSSKSSGRLNKVYRSKSRKDLTLKTKNTATSTEKTLKTAIARNKKISSASSQQKLNLEVPTKQSQTSITEKAEGSNSELRLKEICFIKNAEGKTVIAKYKNKESEEFDDRLIVSWDAPASKATVFTHKSRVSSAPNFLYNTGISEPGTSKNVFRVHNFAKCSSASKSRMKTKTLRRLASTNDLGKVDKKKKIKKKLKAK